MTKISQSEWQEIQSNLERRSRQKEMGDKDRSVYFRIVPPERPTRWNLMTFVGLGLIGLGILLLILGVR